MPCIFEEGHARKLPMKFHWICLGFQPNSKSAIVLLLLLFN